MPTINLRAYNRQIDGLIESGKNDEAILHCHNILKSFPRHIDTYRLLGKAFLELKQFENAEIIFNQVLSVYPDDFISHMGLSFIYETRSDFSSSVDHMERTFELQPANPTIQDELKRLYKARDGIEPVRIRLTRGALIKMYARSNLYTQAIAEIRVALHEHMDRFDLEVILAKMLFLSGQHIEAVENCLNIISKHPFCFDANHILVQALPESSEAKDIIVFQSRLNEIDPYYKFVSKERPDVYSIPDIAVSIDEWQAIPATLNNPIDWQKLVEESWKEKNELVSEDNKNEEIDWEEIINKHFVTSENEVLSEENTQSSEKPIEPESIIESIAQEKPTQQDEDNESPEIGQEPLSQPNSDEKDEPLKSDYPEPIPEWLKIDDQIEAKEEPAQSINDQPQEELEIEDSGFVDHDAPILPDNQKENNIPPSVWIQDTQEIVKDNIQEVNRDSKKTDEPIEQKKEIEPKSEGASHSDQYYEVVLKDAHDALLSGFSQRAVEGYLLLLRENKMSESTAQQLEDDLINFPENFELWIILGDAYHRLGMSTKALEIYQQAEKHLNNSKGENV